MIDKYISKEIEKIPFNEHFTDPMKQIIIKEAESVTFNLEKCAEALGIAWEKENEAAIRELMDPLADPQKYKLGFIPNVTETPTAKALTAIRDYTSTYSVVESDTYTAIRNILEGLNEAIYPAIIDGLEVTHLDIFFLEQEGKSEEEIISFTKARRAIIQKIKDDFFSQKSDAEQQEPMRHIPDELKSSKAKRILKAAEREGLLVPYDGGYQWKKGKALLAYFASVMSEYLNLSKKIQDGKPTTSWAPFEIAFGVENLRAAKNEWRNKSGTLPRNYEKINHLFD